MLYVGNADLFFSLYKMFKLTLLNIHLYEVYCMYLLTLQKES